MIKEFGIRKNPEKKGSAEIEPAKGIGGRRFTERPTPAEWAAALKARSTALAEKQVRLDKEAAERAEAQRVLKLWHAEQAKKSGPHIITSEQAREAEQFLKKFEPKHNKKENKN